MNNKRQIQSDQSKLELGEGLPANSKLAQATYAPAAEKQLLLPEHNRPFLFPVLLRCPDCAPRTDGGGTLAGSLWTADKPVGPGSFPTAPTGL